jgi:flagellar basal-body rod modification protein FlgD
MSVNTTYDYSSSTVQQRELEAKNAAYGTSTTDFLQLLIAQLTTQDPLNPMEDTDFTSQLARLQTLEEQIAMTKSMNAMRMDVQVQSATAMIGKEVVGIDKNGNSASGMVSRVVQTADDVYVELASGQQISVSGVTDISSGDSAVNQDLTTAANCIGLWVDAGYDSALQPVQGIVESVGISGGQVHLQLYGGKSVPLSQVVSMRASTENEVWYTLPDDVRESVEKAQTMLAKVVTGNSTAGKTVTGIVANAELAEDNNVYLILFDGTRINVEDISGDPQTPTAEDAIRDLIGLWASGLDEGGDDIEGLIAGAEDRDDGLALILSDGRHVYFDALTEITDAPDGEADT